LARKLLVFIINLVSQVVRFLIDESGQELMEYSLLLTFIVLASALLFVSFGGSVAGI
jgi:hypothetical protein